MRLASVGAAFVSSFVATTLLKAPSSKLHDARTPRNRNDAELGGMPDDVSGGMGRGNPGNQGGAVSAMSQNSNLSHLLIYGRL